MTRHKGIISTHGFTGNDSPSSFFIALSLLIVVGSRVLDNVKCFLLLLNKNQLINVHVCVSTFSYLYFICVLVS